MADHLLEEADRIRTSFTSITGDPPATAGALLKVVDSDDPPLRVFFVDVALQATRAEYERRLQIWAEWQPIAVGAQG